MGLFRHPHLVRGVVHTSQGSFVISRGLVDVPDEVGDAHGWQRMHVDEDGEPMPIAARSTRKEATPLAL